MRRCVYGMSRGGLDDVIDDLCSTFSRCCSDLAEAEARARADHHHQWAIHIHLTTTATVYSIPYQSLYTFLTIAFDNLETFLQAMRSTIVRLAAEATHSRTPMIHFLGKRANLEYSQSSCLVSLSCSSLNTSNHPILNFSMLRLLYPQSLTPRAPTQPLLRTSSTTSNPSFPNSSPHPPLPTAPPVTLKDNP
jgi:hypothetical protein